MSALNRKNVNRNGQSLAKSIDALAEIEAGALRPTLEKDEIEILELLAARPRHWSVFVKIEHLVPVNFSIWGLSETSAMARLVRARMVGMDGEKYFISAIGLAWLRARDEEAGAAMDLERPARFEQE